jgi:uncharacterized protein (TIGR02246 family)
MPVYQLHDLHPVWAAGVNAGDLEALMALYEPDAALVAQPGQTVAGSEAIRAALAWLLSLKGAIAIEPRQIIEADGIGLLISDWRMTATGADGAPVELTGRTTDIARRQPDGAWRVVIDNPYGVAA